MQLIYLKPTDDAVRLLVPKTFPDYQGRKFKLAVHEQPGMNLHSYWSGGSRSYYEVILLETFETLSVPENGAGFTPDLPNAMPQAVPMPNVAVVEHSIYCGKDAGITIHIHRDNATKMIPAPVADSLTDDEWIVLLATATMVASKRFEEAHGWTKITQARFAIAKLSLTAKGFLDKRGSCTIEGRNARGSRHLHEFAPKVS